MTKRELWRKHRTRLLPMLAALMIFVGIVFCGQVQETVESTPVDSWGKSVDGLAGRLIVTPRCAVGQAISVVIEIKNTSNKRRYFVPRLDPLASEWLTVGVSGPNGELRQGMRAAGYHTVELWTQSMLVAARRIYSAAGFRLVTEEPHRSFGQDLVGEHWQLSLQEGRRDAA